MYKSVQDQRGTSLYLRAWLLAVILLLIDSPQLSASDYPPPADPLLQLVAGHTIAEWRLILPTIDLQSPASQDLVPGLIELATSPAVPWITRRQAAYTLGRMGDLASAAVKPLAKLLDETVPSEPEALPASTWAAKALSLFGPIAAPASRTLIDLLNDPNRDEAEQLLAIEALGNIGSASPSGLAALLQVVIARSQRGGSDSQTQQADFRVIVALDTVANVRPPVQAAIPICVRLLDDSNEMVANAAARSLQTLGQVAAPAIPALLDHIANPNSLVKQVAAADAIGAIAESPPAEVVDWLASTETSDVLLALQVCKTMRVRARPVVPQIEAILQSLEADQEPELALACCETLLAIDRGNLAAITGLVPFLASINRDDRATAAVLLQKTPELPETVHQQLIQLSRQGNLTAAKVLKSRKQKIK
jgi:HEAT repeat protein